MARKSRAYALSRRAEADLEAIFAYTARAWSALQAERYLRQLYQAFAEIAAGELIGRESELGLMKLVVNRHVVYFQPRTTGVLIVRVLHGAMDAGRHIAGDG